MSANKKKAPSEEMRYRCSLLAQEILSWPKVTDRLMFGFRAFYRGSVVFAMFPDKRAMENPSAIWYKLNDPRIKKEGPKWHAFELDDDRSVGTALGLLEKAYSRATSGGGLARGARKGSAAEG